MLRLSETDVLVMVDDNPGDLGLARHCCELSGLTSPWLEFSSGKDLLTHLSAARAGVTVMPRLVLLDLNMPRMSGFDVLSSVRKDHLPGPSFYVLTSSADPRDRARAAELGAAAFLTKPDDLDAWVDLFRELRA